MQSNRTPPAGTRPGAGDQPATDRHDDRDDDFERGLRNRRAALGPEWVEKSTQGAQAFNAEFQHLITRYAWHEIWGRPGLDFTTRRLLVLGMTMGLARWEEFELHCRAAIRGGVPLEKIQETLMQGAIYCGVPAANTAFKITTGILQAEGRLPPPSPLNRERQGQVHTTFSQPQLRVRVQGQDDGLPVVMSHPLGLDSQVWDALALELSEHHPVLRWDHRGHGGSARARSGVSLDDLVDDAARVIREWGRGPVAFIGLSLGGMVGQGLAIRHPECVDRLFLANTVARYSDDARQAWAQRVAAVREGGMDAVEDLVVSRYLHEAARREHPEWEAALRNSLQRQTPQDYAAVAEAVARVNWWDRLPEIRCPTWVVAGGRDAGAPPALGEAIAQRIPGARFALLEEASHLSVIEAPEAFHTLVQAWLTAPRAPHA